MKDTDLYMTASLLSFVAACIAGLATLAGPYWMTGAFAVTVFLTLFVVTFRFGLAARHPRPARKMTTMEINLARFQAASA